MKPRTDLPPRDRLDTARATVGHTPVDFTGRGIRRRLASRLPATLAPAKPGDHFKAEFDAEEDTLVFRRVAKRADWLAVLKACPADMDDLPPRRREYPDIF